MKMDAFTGFVERWLAPSANKIAGQKHIQVLQSAFLTLIPFFTIGSFALIIITPPVDYTSMGEGFGRSFFAGWQAVADFTSPALNPIYQVTVGAISLYVAAGIGFYLAKHHKMTTFLPVAVSLATFAVLGLVDGEGALTTAYLGGTGLFTAIVGSILGFELYRFLLAKRIGHIELAGGGVPPALTDSIGALVPITVVLLGAGVISALTTWLTDNPFPALIGTLMEPVVGGVDSVWGIALLALLVMLLWWFGIHDTVITGPLTPFLLNNLTANTAAYAAGTAAIALPYVVTEPFWWTFMAIGGSGATLGLAFMAVFSKSRQIKTVGRLTIVPSLFNINEPLIFGLPLMYNPVLMFPFVFTMAFNAVVTFLFMDAGLVARTFADPSWNMISPIGAMLSTMDLKAVALVVGLIVVDALIYFPFFKVFERQRIAQEQAEDSTDDSVDATNPDIPTTTPRDDALEAQA